ncbi:hypothetical protein ACTHR6_01760 [Ralstonia holmesii]|uniref:hypothetical protein n=1 Tax=Ralstonia TaxID=48736 RepID=UPI000468109E|nr:hypothetical protein [Ralstonia pickettii]
MSELNTYSLTLLGVKHNVSRIFFNTREDFTEDDRSGKSDSSRRRPALIPTTPLAVAALSQEDILDRASQATIKNHLRIESLRVSDTETIGDFLSKALMLDTNRAVRSGTKYDNYAKQRFGKSYSQFVDELRRDVVKRFHEAFDKLEYVPPMLSNWPPHSRDIVNEYEVAAPPDVIDELADLASQGHIHSQYLVALLRSFTERKLTRESVNLLLEAHENKHPQALDALARYLLVGQDYTAALQCALISLEGRYPHAKYTIQLFERSVAGKVIVMPRGVIPALKVVLESELDGKFQSLARKHCPEWFPSEEELMRSFFQRHLGGTDHV